MKLMVFEWIKRKCFGICLNAIDDYFKISYEKPTLSPEVITQLNNPLYFSGVITSIWEAASLYSVCI